MKKRYIVDLHGFNIQQALSKVELAWDYAFEYYYDELQIVTGKGSGTIKTSIEDMLLKEGYSYIEDSNSASFIVDLSSINDFEDYSYDDEKYN